MAHLIPNLLPERLVSLANTTDRLVKVSHARRAYFGNSTGIVTERTNKKYNRLIAKTGEFGKYAPWSEGY